MSRAKLLSERRHSRKTFRFPKDKLLKFLKSVLLCAFILAPIIAIPRLIPIYKVSCESQFGECSNSLKQKLESIKVNNYINTKLSLDKLMAKDVFVKTYAIRYKLPSEFVVTVIERNPVVALAKEGATSDFAHVDDEGFIIEVLQETQLPILVIDKESHFEVGQKVPNNFLFAVLITEQAFKKYNSRLVILKTDAIEVDLPIGVTAIFPREGDADVLFGSLSLILSRLNTEELALRISKDNLPKVIDLRYKNPVVK